MTRLFCLFLMAVLMVLPVSVQAKDTAALSAKLDQQTEKLMAGLNQNQMKQFQAIRNTHGVVRAVEHTQDLMLEAMTSCGKHHPDRKDAYDQAIASWNQAVSPVLDAGWARMKEMIALQSFAKPSTMNAYIKLYDQVTDAKTVKTHPITSKSDCDDLMKDMKRKQNKVISLMNKSIGLDKPLLKLED